MLFSNNVLALCLATLVDARAGITNAGSRPPCTIIIIESMLSSIEFTATSTGLPAMTAKLVNVNLSSFSVPTISSMLKPVSLYGK